METKQEVFARYRKEYYKAKTFRGGREIITKIIDVVKSVTNMHRKSIIRIFYVENFNLITLQSIYLLMLADFFVRLCFDLSNTLSCDTEF